MLVKKSQVVPIECVVRGYLAGSGWKEYQANGRVCGVPLPAGLRESSKLPEPIFTPATKAESGHDVNISFEEMVERGGRGDRRRNCAAAASTSTSAPPSMPPSCGLIVADTKFEWGHWQDELILIDEVLTPDSSRFWPADGYKPGRGQPSYDKQFVRDWLESTTWDKNSPPPQLPAEVAEKTRAKYVEAYERLTGSHFAG